MKHNFFKWDNIFLIVSLLFLVAVVVPLLVLAQYATPWYDDYDAALFTHSFLEQEDHFVFSNMMRGVLYRVKTSWYAWQGTYASIFLMALCPIEHYSIGCYLIIGLFLISLFTFSGILMKKILKADISSTISITSFVTGILFLTMHSASEAFFWYNGGVHYIGMFSFLLLFLVCVIVLLKSDKIIMIVGLEVLAIFLAVLVAGGNFVGVMYGGLCILTIAALTVITGNKKGIFLLLPTFAYGAGMYINISAPGNMVRQSYFINSRFGLIQSVLFSFKSSIEFIFEFKGMIFIFVSLVALLPMIYKVVCETNFRFSCPILVSAWSYCMYAAGFAPSYYAMGIPGAERTINIIKVMLIILLVINEIYWVGWMVQRYQKRKGALPKYRFAGIHLVVAILAMIVSFTINSEKEKTFSSYSAVKSLVSGDAEIYYSEYLERKKIIESETMDMVFRPYSVRPMLLSISDYSENANAGPNVMLARYYSKYSLRVE